LNSLKKSKLLFGPIVLLWPRNAREVGTLDKKLVAEFLCG